MAITLEAGDPAPDFALPGPGTGTMHSLAGYQGRTVVLYFYPRDETPGCTTQACSFRGQSRRKSRPKAPIVLGVSKDDADSHVKFRERPPACRFPCW